MKKLLLFGGKENMIITELEAFHAKVAMSKGTILELPRLKASLNGKGIAGVVPYNEQEFYVLDDSGQPHPIFEHNDVEMVSVDDHTRTIAEYEEQIGEKLKIGKTVFLEDDLIMAERKNIPIFQAGQERMKQLKELEAGDGHDLKNLLDKPDAANNDL